MMDSAKSDGFKEHELSQVTKEDALAVNSISTSAYEKIVGVRWIGNQSKFNLHISLPDGYEEIKRKKIRAWEEEVYSRVVVAREIFGKHALIVTRDTFPSQPAWWSNVEKRMRSMVLEVVVNEYNYSAKRLIFSLVLETML